MCLSETDSHKQKRMTSESPRYIPITTTTTSSSYRSDRSTTHFDGPNTGSNTIRSAHELVHDTHRLDNPQDLYRQHRNEHLDSTTVGGSLGRSLSGTSSHSARRPETSTRARRILQEHAAAGHGHGLGLTGGIRARDGSGGDDDNGMALSFVDGGDDNYTHVPFPTHGGGSSGLGTSRGAPASSAINLPIRNHGDRSGHHPYSNSHSRSHYDRGTDTGTIRNHHHRERHSLHTPRPPPPREPKERTTTYFVQDNILMRISSISHSHSHSSVSHAHSSHSSHAHSHSQSGTHHHSYPTTIDNMNDPSGDSSNSNPNFTSHNTSDSMSTEHRGGGSSSADHKRRKWYRDRMARIIQDIEPGLPPPPSSSFSSSTFSSGRLGSGGRGAGAGAGGYNYMYPGMGSSALGSGGSGGGGYADTDTGAGAGGYGATNARDSGYESFPGSPGGSFGRGRGH
ncbi:uncharacterized protein B0T23DRAFT_129036 [Neurospora hispaniola]|uniref:Uncharacterized protein n=1 Tax=Neurospora hispaniola TaxID=588809 RepID=A0AAJ0IAZ6_9PEZI|nr:hypothetical protein B0T23DRAFT_129036 [Neurospora hispaniola]